MSFLRIALFLLLAATSHSTAAPERAFIKAPDASAEDYFGHSIAMDGDTMAVGAPERDYRRGAVYVYVRSGSSWTWQATLANPTEGNSGIGDEFGHSVAISGDLIVVGSHGSRVDGTGALEGQTQSGAGSAHIYVRDGENWSKEASITSSYPDSFDRFGWSVAISGDVVVVGAFQEGSDGIGGEETDDAARAGAAYVFEKSAGGWGQTAFLKASNAEAFDYFGRAVAVDGNIVVVGAYRESGNGIDGDADNSKGSSGAVYVFERVGGDWLQAQLIKASDADFGDEFGGAVSIDGEFLAVGAEDKDTEDGAGNTTSYDTGRVYVFQKTGGAWMESTSVRASNEGGRDHFGCSVALSGDRLIVGSYGEDGSGLSDEGAVGDSGAAYVFQNGVGGWLETDYLKASNPGGNDRLGSSVAISGGFVAASAIYEDSGADGLGGLMGNDLEVDSGAVYVFEPGAPIGPEISVGQNGSAVVSGNYADTFGVACVDGQAFRRTFSIHNLGDAPLTGIAAGLVGAGAGEFAIDVTGVPSALESGESAEFTVAYVPLGAVDSNSASVEISSNDSDEATYHIHLAGFVSPLQWLESGEVSSVGSLDEDFGRSMAIDGDTLVVGAPLEGIVVSDGPGLAYVFKKEGGEWIEQAILSPSNAVASDSIAFGISVAIDGDVIVVGASREDGPVDNNLIYSGAAYIFERQGDSWVETAYLKASNPDSFDHFGETVAVSGGIVAVASESEDSDGTGTGEDNELKNAGAVYLFEKQGGEWIQQQFLKSSQPEKSAGFGSALALSGDRLFVGSELASEPQVANAGAVFEFSLVAGNWVPAGVIRGSNSRGLDSFGASLALSGDTLVVGAYDPDRSSDNLKGSGAAYVFVEDGGSWTEQAMLKAPSADASDHFGFSLALVGDRLLVGAPNEDGDGVRGILNNGSHDAGAVYEFRRSAGAWVQSRYLKSSKVDETVELGTTVLIDGAEALLGAKESDRILRYEFDLPTEPILLLSTDDGTVIGNGGSVEFGFTRIFSESRRALTIRNGGRLPLSDLSFEIIGADEGFDASSIAGCLEGAESSAWTIEFNPSTTGLKNAIIRISSPSLGSPFEVNLSGTGIDLLQIAQEAYLKSSNSGEGDIFGYSSAVDGDTVVIGGYEAGRGSRGAAYVFVRRGGGWFQEAILEGAFGFGTYRFGTDVDISGDTIVVGAPSTNFGRGAACVFVRDAGSWTQQACVTASTAGSSYSFGHSVAIDADTIVVGDNRQNNNSGAAYIFAREGTEWQQQDNLIAPNVEREIYFGQAVSISEERVAIGALGVPSWVTGEFGSVYVFARDGTDWSLEARVTAGEESRTNSKFGTACAIDQNRLVVGAPRFEYFGGVFVYEKGAGGWVQQGVLRASNQDRFDEFGYAVDIAGDQIVVGAFDESSDSTGIGGPQQSNLASGSGAVYLFEKLSADWFQSAYIKASNTGEFDSFGISVALSGDFLVAGASFEDSGSTGVNGDQLNDQSEGSGAAYIFALNGTRGEALFEAAAASAGLFGDGVLPSSRPFGDSIDNLTKYAFNLNLAQADSHTMEASGISGLPLVELVEGPDGSALRIEFLHRLDSGLIYVPKMSEDLSSGSWISLQGPPEITPIDAEWERVLYVQPLSDPLPERLFGRVDVSLLEDTEKPSTQ